MKIGKAAIIALFVSSLLLVSIGHVSAFEESGEINDGAGDVVQIDFDTQEERLATESPYIDIDNLDIVKVTYAFTDTHVDLEFIVKGEIENRGSTEESSGYVYSYDMDDVAYTISIETEEGGYYDVIYINNTCKLSYEAESVNITDFSVDGGTLTISFDLDTSEETFYNISAKSEYIRTKFNLSDPYFDPYSVEFIWMSDQAPNLPLEIIYAEPDTNLAEIGEEVNFTSYVSYGLPPYQYHWDFGDGTESNEKDPIHSYTKAGKYNIEFTVTDDEGTQETYPYEITVSSGEENQEEAPITLFIGIIIVIVVIGILGVIILIRR